MQSAAAAATAAAALRRAAATLAPRGARRFAGGPPGGFFSEGTQTGRNGYLFGETPPPPGQRRQWEAWEAPWCVAITPPCRARCAAARVRPAARQSGADLNAQSGARCSHALTARPAL